MFARSAFFSIIKFVSADRALAKVTEALERKFIEQSTFHVCNNIFVGISIYFTQYNYIGNLIIFLIRFDKNRIDNFSHTHILVIIVVAGLHYPRFERIS